MRRGLHTSVFSQLPGVAYDPWEALANAIVIQAVTDGRECLRQGDKAGAWSIMRWLRSDWAALLCRGAYDRVCELYYNELIGGNDNG